MRRRASSSSSSEGSPRGRAGFVPRSQRQQLAAIGLSPDGQTLQESRAYDVARQRGEELFKALAVCLDPSGGDWEDIEPPQPHEWLEAMLDKTPDQSFTDYVRSRPNRPDGTRHVIYLQPICEPGELEGPAFPEGTWPSWRVLEAAAARFFAPLPVRTLPAISMNQLSPRPASRKGSWGGIQQWHAGQALDALIGRVPRDAYGLMAVTMCDLYPRPEWNFVYGLARLTQRVGIFSFVRHTPERGPLAARLEANLQPWLGAQLLHRSVKTLLHEIGHMFGLKHCTWYNCLMRGSNGEQVEHQANYLHLCPVCLRKLHWSIGFDIREQYAGLLEIYREFAEHHPLFARDCDFLQSRLAKMEALPAGATLIAPVPRLATMREPAPRAAADEGGRRRAGSTPALRPSSSSSLQRSAQNRSSLAQAPNRSSLARSGSRVVHTPGCPCCSGAEESTAAGGLSLRQSYAAGKAAARRLPRR